jgi:hypothetical protein
MAYDRSHKKVEPATLQPKPAPIGEEEEMQHEETVPKRTVKVQLEPINISISYWSLERFVKVLQASTSSSSEDKRTQTFLKNLKHLRANMYQRPLNYMDNTIIEAINKSIDVEVNMNNISMDIYENSSLLLSPQTLHFEVSTVRFLRKRLEQSLKKKENHNYDIFLQSDISVRELSLVVVARSESESNFEMIKTSALVSIKKNLIENSPMLTESIVRVFVPSIHVFFPSDTYHIAKLLAIFSKEDSNLGVHPPSVLEKKRQAHRYLTITNLVRELTPLLTDIGNEHDYDGTGQDNKVCRHCIFKYRKSTAILQVTIGWHQDYNTIASTFELASNGNYFEQSVESGICLKIPETVIEVKEPLDIRIPFIQIVQEDGLFKKTTSVFVDSIESVANNTLNPNFTFKVQPYWLVADPSLLFKPNFYKSLWKRNLDYFKFLSNSEGNHVGDPPFLDCGKASLKDENRKLYLLFFYKGYNNKSMLGKLDGVRKEDNNSFYKKFIQLRLKSVEISQTDMGSFASAFNILSNIMLNKDLERYLENLLRPIKATGIDEKRKEEQEAAEFGHTTGATDQLSKPDGTRRESIISKPNQETEKGPASNQEVPNKKDDEYSCNMHRQELESELGAGIEYKEVFTLRELFEQLVLDISVDKIDVLVNYLDTTVGLRMEIFLGGDDIHFNINKQNPFRVAHYEEQTNKTNVRVENYANIGKLEVRFGKLALNVQDIGIDYDLIHNDFLLKIGYLIVDSNKGEERLLQIGLDEPKLARQLKYYALFFRIDFDQKDNLANLELIVKHTRAALSTDVIIDTLKRVETLKKTLFVYKVQVFNAMRSKYQLRPEDIDLEREISTHRASLDPTIIAVALLHKLISLKELTQLGKRPVPQADLSKTERKPIKISLTVHSLCVLLQFSVQNEKAKNFLRIDISDLFLEYKQNSSLEATFKDFQVCPHSVIPKYQTIIKNPNVQNKQIIGVEFRSQEDTTVVKLGNLQIFILMRVIDEIESFTDTITDEKNLFVAKLAEIHPEMDALLRIIKEQKKKKTAEKSTSKTKIELENIDVIFPRHSKSEAYVRFHIPKGELVFSSTQHPYCVPDTNVIQKAVKDKHVADILPRSIHRLDSILVEGKGLNMGLFIMHEGDTQEICLSDIQQCGITLTIPSEKEVNGWKVNAVMDLKIGQMRISFKVGNMVKLSLIMDDNSDEESPFIKLKHNWYKDIELTFSIDSGSSQISILKILDTNAVRNPLGKED